MSKFTKKLTYSGRISLQENLTHIKFTIFFLKIKLENGQRDDLNLFVIVEFFLSSRGLCHLLTLNSLWTKKNDQTYQKVLQGLVFEKK